MQLPEALKNTLEQTNATEALEIWKYLDGNPNAIHEMIETVVESHSELAKITIVRA